MCGVKVREAGAATYELTLPHQKGIAGLGGENGRDEYSSSLLTFYLLHVCNEDHIRSLSQTLRRRLTSVTNVAVFVLSSVTRLELPSQEFAFQLILSTLRSFIRCPFRITRQDLLIACTHAWLL
jgi:hypothetical protein